MCNQCNDSNQEHVHALRTRREVLKAGAALVAAPFLGGVTSIVQAAQAAGTGVPVGRPAHARAGIRGAATEWLNYAGDKAGSKVFTAHSDKRRQFQSPENRVDMAIRRRGGRESKSSKNLGLGIHSADGRRRSVRQYLALPGRGHRRRDRQDPVDLRPRDMEERNAIQQWLRASRRRLLGRW